MRLAAAVRARKLQVVPGPLRHQQNCFYSLDTLVWVQGRNTAFQAFLWDEGHDFGHFRGPEDPVSDLLKNTWIPPVVAQSF